MKSVKKILAVDDEPTVIDYLKALIESWKYEFSSCDSSDQALEKISEEKPDLILLDVMLPDSDGITLCRRIKSNPETNRIPVIMLTSLSDSTTIKDSRLFGASDYVSKPVEEKVLKTKINNALSKLSSK